MTAMPPPVPPPPAPSGKSSGCLKWGLIGCGLATLIGIAAIAGIIAVVIGGIRNSDVYSGARNAAERDSRVIAALGAPMQPGWWVMGNVKLENRTGSADLEFPLIGSRQRGTVHAVAELENERWRYTTLTVTPKSGPVIDILQPER